jgi:Hemerythrin HHE cation binding domain
MTVDVTEHHHYAEEENLFPDIEEDAGKKEPMKGKKKQHHGFYQNLHAFRGAGRIQSRKTVS